MGRIVLANIVLIGISVWIHYESLRMMSDWFQRQEMHRRFHLLVAVFGAITAHFIEIAIYGVGFYILLSQPDMGSFSGVTDSSLQDCIYFSVSNFSSLGMGDIQPLGLIRFVAGFEALLGLVLITWTASFLFLEMQRIWQPGNSVGRK